MCAWKPSRKSAKLGTAAPRLGRVVCAVVLAAAGLSAGCANSLRDWAGNGFKVGPEYCTPAAPVQSQWIDYEKDPRVSLGKIDASAWWTVFNDPKLDALMHQASCQNLSLRVAGARILQAKALRGIAVGNIFPQTQQATADYNRVALSQNVANPQSTPFYNQFDAGFNLSWELDFWGRFRRAVESADAALNSSIEGYDNALVLLLSEVATSYVELRVAQEQMRRTAENIQSQEQVLAVAQKRFDAKVITKLDLLQVRDNVAQSKANLQGLRNKARLASDALCVLLGLPPHDLTADPMVGDGPVPVVPGKSPCAPPPSCCGGGRTSVRPNAW